MLRYIRCTYSTLLLVLCVALGSACPCVGYSQVKLSEVEALPRIKVLGQHEYPAEIDLMTGDTMAVIYLKDTYCFTRKHFRNRKHEDNYWRMVNDVKKTLPIAKDARRLILDIYTQTEGMSEKQQREYFKTLEKDLFAQYKPRLKKLNYRQGKLLVRLIDRECDRQSYQLIREFLGRSRAFFWNMFGKMFGVSLKTEWDPQGKDRELEDVCIQVEQGLI